MSRAIVLGGAGFIGSALVAHLERQGTSVIVVGRPRDDGARCDVQGDIGEMDLVKLFGGVDTVFHVAGAGSVPPSLKDPIGDLDHVRITLRVLEAVRFAQSQPRLVVASSAAVYGDSVSLPMAEEHPKSPLSPYGVSKLAIEHYVSLYHHLYGVRAACARLFSVYGPGQRKLVVYDLMRRLTGDERDVVVAAPAEVARDFVFVDDVARALDVISLRAEATGEAYNVGSGVGTTLQELVSTIASVTSSTAHVRFSGELRPGDPARWFADVAKLRTLGMPMGTSLADGLATTYEWYSEQSAE